MITWHHSDTDVSAQTIAHHNSDGNLPVDEEGKSPPQFPVCEKWNKCIALCQSNGFEVHCDALIRATDENLAVTFQDPKDLVDQAGPELKDELLGLDDCPTGDVRVTNSYKLQYPKRLIHAVPPLYSANFHTASLSALHSVYKNILNAAIEMKFRTLVIPPMFVVPGDFPAEGGCHLVLRTFRRYFDHFGPEPFVDSIILTCPNDDFLALYRKVLPVYFPRNEEEELLSLSSIIPQDDGFGGPLIKERAIPIKVLVPRSAEEHQEEEVETSPSESDCARSAALFGSISAPPSDYWRVQRIRATGRPMFSFGSSHSLTANQEGSPKPNQTPPPSPKPRSSVSASTHSALVDRSLKADLSKLVASGFLSVVGTDKIGRHVVVMKARELDLSQFDLNQILLYFVRVLEPVASRSSNGYVFIYCHTLAGEKALTSQQANALVKALTENDPRYVEKLMALYVLHTDWRTRLNLTYAKMAVLPREVSDRLVTVHCCRTIAEELLPINPSAGTSTSNGIDALLPAYVVEFDENDHKDHQG